MSWNTNGCQGSPPHIAVFPGAGMGHLIPILRLASMLASRNCIITVIAVQPTVSAAESAHITAFFATHPHINRLDFHILPSTPSNSPTKTDHFFAQFEAISHSIHLLYPMLSASSPPLSTIFTDFVVAASVSRVADDLCIPYYIVSTTSARFFSLLAYLPHLKLENYYNSTGSSRTIEIPGLTPLPLSSIPPPFFDPSNLFASVAVSNAPSLSKARGVLLNTFDWFETETLTALNNGQVSSNLAPVLPIGPFEPPVLEQGHCLLPWLDEQAAKSVLYISFGSRTTMSKEQMRELGTGLERSGHKFLWVLKGNKVDKEDKEQVQDLLDESFIERTKNKGMLVKGWVNQEEILAHPSIGGFVSHCGWNSVIEAARRGVPVLAWPQHGDQKINAEVVEKAGLGVRVSGWGWGGEGLVKGEEIGEKIRGLMEDDKVRAKANKVGEEAKNCGMVSGSSQKAFHGVIQMLKPKKHLELAN
ncbi:hypothetical protein LguiA_006320 [Lonicera macranthoides]